VPMRQLLDIHRRTDKEHRATTDQPAAAGTIAPDPRRANATLRSSLPVRPSEKRSRARAAAEGCDDAFPGRAAIRDGRRNASTRPSPDGYGRPKPKVVEQNPGRPRFEDLYASEHRRLFRALCVILHDPSDAEDVEQEAFVRVFERWERVGAMRDPTGYLYRVAMNVVRGRYRRARVAGKAAFVAARRDEIAEVDERDIVTRMLAVLTPSQRAAIILTVALGYSSDEAHEILGIPASSIRVLTARARASLRRAATSTTATTTRSTNLMIFCLM
jgi:RNA polymerase sigma-70 factor, ECF subfamily